MTNIPLKKQAKLIGVSPGVLRTWRSEEAFLERLIRGCWKEFLDETLPNAGEIALQFVDAQRSGHNVNFANKDGKSLEEEVVEELGGPVGLGFNDAHLYGFGLVRMILHDGLKALSTVKKSLDMNDKDIGAKAAEKYRHALRWVLPVSRVYRTFPSEHRSAVQAQLAGMLARIQVTLFSLSSRHSEVQALLELIDLIAVLIAFEVTVDPDINKALVQRPKRISATIQDAAKVKA
jgi:hypothetical protein